MKKGTESARIYGLQLGYSPLNIKKGRFGPVSEGVCTGTKLLH